MSPVFSLMMGMFALTDLLRYEPSQLILTLMALCYVFHISVTSVQSGIILAALTLLAVCPI